MEVDAGAAEVLAWFTGQFLALGWSAEAPIPTSGVAYMRFLRDADERLGCCCSAWVIGQLTPSES